MISNKKSSIILVLKVLEEYSDEDHYLTQKEILDKIKDIYGIELERKSIGYSLQLLEELDYDIVKGPKGGFALLSRTFDITEASYVIDAIFSSRSIDGQQALKISDEISSCFSKYQRRDYSYIYKSYEVNRTTNKQVLYSISIIQEAIKRRKRVGFQYVSYDEKGNEILKNDGYEYIVSPYYMINNFGRYYLLCNYREKYRAIQLFKMDRMVNIKIKEDWNIKPLSSLENGPKNFSISKYINDHIYMFNDEVINVELILNDSSIIGIVKEWFGDNSKISYKNNEIHAYIKCDQSALYYWITQYADCVKVISPSSFKDKVINGLKEALKNQL